MKFFCSFSGIANKALFWGMGCFAYLLATRLAGVEECVHLLHYQATNVTSKYPISDFNSSCKVMHTRVGK